VDCICVDNTPPVICIDELPCSSLKIDKITGTAADACAGLAKVEVLIENCKTGKFWDGEGWVNTKTWLKAEGTADWSFDSCEINFELDTNYAIKARATDCAGNQCEAETSLYWESDSICLFPGWNFISVPNTVIRDFDTFGELLQGVDFKRAFAYDPCEGFISLSPDSKVKVLSGYWIKMEKNGEIKFAYDSCGQTILPSKELKGKAWNAIGPSGADVGAQIPVYTELKSIEDSWSTLVAWDNANQRYMTSIIAPGESQEMTLGQGYWIWMKNDDTLCAITTN